MRVMIVIGSRADEGLLRIVGYALATAKFEVTYLGLQGRGFADAFDVSSMIYEDEQPELVIVLGDRFEILAATTSAHLRRVPVAHIGGGDVTEGSYDDAMRDCITRMSSIHFVTSTQSEVRVQYLMGQKNVHMVGSPVVDFIMHGDWKRERPIEGPYVVVAYYPETIDGTVDLDAVKAAINGRKAIWIKPNLDAKSTLIPGVETYKHADFLNLLYHCEEFIGNSSSLYYEAPFLGIKTREIGKRQKGRVIPFGDGRACERIVKILKEWRA